MAELKDIKSLTLEELTRELKTLGEPAFRAKQLYEWMHVKMARSYEEMGNIPKALKEKLSENFTYTCLEAVRIQESKLDGTKKFLFSLGDGNVIESVWMEYRFGVSVCISSQVGCRMGCKFCASTLDGVERNLTPSEMLDQIYAMSRYMNQKVGRVVVMGSGEPLDNYENLLRFIQLLTDEKGMNLSGRSLTVSTCGLVPRMRELADLHLQINLALSLHASSDAKRQQLMPIANTYSLEEVMGACRYYFAQTGRQLTFEYALVGGVNDTPEDARALAELLEGLNCVVNLIPVNPIKERSYTSSTKEQVLAFKKKLEKAQINVTIRREMGRDIDGACGQLRRRHLNGD